MTAPSTAASEVEHKVPADVEAPAEPEQPTTASTFDIALFERIDRPQVQPKIVSLDELVDMLSRFEVLDDKRRGQCWSPTKYTDGVSTRGNAGVESVSCLVFDLDLGRLTTSDS